MSSRLISLFLATGVVVVCGYLLARTEQPAIVDLTPKVANFEVTSANGLSFLVDATNGRTWVLGPDKSGKIGWVALRQFEKNDAEPLRIAAPGMGAIEGLIPLGKTTVRLPLEQQGYTRVHLRHTTAGFLNIRGKIAGAPVNLLVDTGACHTYLDRKRVEPLKLKWEVVPWARQTEPSIRQLASTRDPGQVTTVDSIEVGSFHTGRLRIQEYDMSDYKQRVSYYGDPPADGVLGADVFDPAWAVIDYKANDLFLFSRDSPD
jgi:hypothetical protein